MDNMIPQFKSFLSEATLYEDYLMEAALSGGLSNDDKGKLHELLLAKHLHPDKQLPEHFRAEGPEAEEKGHAGSPQGVHDKLMNKVGPEAYNEIDSHAKQTAKALTDEMKANGVTSNKAKIGSVHWTSNRDRPGAKGDHEKLTGVKDVNSNADLMLSLHDKNGISSWLLEDVNLFDDLNKERETLTQIYNHVVKKDKHKVKKWFYGHFHEHHFTTSEENVDFIMLDMFIERNNVWDYYPIYF